MGKSLKGRSADQSPGCMVLFALPFAGVGIFMAGLTLVTWKKGSSAQSWVEVPAKILSAELETHSDSDGTTYKAVAVYEYQFGGATYRGDRVALHGGADNLGSFQKDAARELMRHQKRGEPFRCYVDPDEPSKSVVYRDLRWGMMLFYSLFAVVFGGAGFGMMSAVIVGGRKRKTEKGLKLLKPEEPWFWRAEWETGQITCESGAAAIPLTVVAIIANIVGWPALMFVWPEIAGGGNKLALFGLLFPALGLLMVWLAIRSWAQRRKYGETRFEMASVPGVIGGKLAGVVHVPRHIEVGAGFRQVLRCIRREVVRRGDDNSVRERALWETQRNLRGELLPGDTTRTAIPVLFAIPFDQPESSSSGTREQVLWRLEVSADVPGIDFEAKYEVPVFRTAESSEEFVLDEAPLADLIAEPDREADFAAEGVRVESAVVGGTSYIFPPARHRSLAIQTTVFFALWCGAIALLAHFKVPMLFLIVTGLVAVGIGLAVVTLWLSTLELRVASDGAWVSKGWLLRGPGKRFAYEKIEAVVIDSDTQVGNDMYYHVALKLPGGKTRKVSGRFRSSGPANSIADDIRRAMIRG